MTSMIQKKNMTCINVISFVFARILFAFLTDKNHKFIGKIKRKNIYYSQIRFLTEKKPIFECFDFDYQSILNNRENLNIRIENTALVSKPIS